MIFELYIPDIVTPYYCQWCKAYMIVFRFWMISHFIIVNHFEI